eukprot:scaffold76206_cov52-Phaeocystis_antarctica.AAC.7
MVRALQLHTRAGRGHTPAARHAMYATQGSNPRRAGRVPGRHGAAAASLLGAPPAAWSCRGDVDLAQLPGAAHGGRPTFTLTSHLSPSPQPNPHHSPSPLTTHHSPSAGGRARGVCIRPRARLPPRATRRAP